MKPNPYIRDGQHRRPPVAERQPTKRSKVARWLLRLTDAQMLELAAQIRRAEELPNLNTRERALAIRQACLDFADRQP